MHKSPFDIVDFLFAIVFLVAVGGGIERTFDPSAQLPYAAMGAHR